MSVFELIINNLDGEQRFEIGLGDTLIGRSAECEVVLDAPGIADIHARVDVTAAGCTITDLNRRSRTRLNTQQLAPHTAVPLRPGDEVQIGLFTLTLRQIGESNTLATDVAKDITVAAVEDATELPPGSQLYYQLTVSTLDTTYMEQFLLQPGSTVVGRGSAADIRLESPRLRLAHARLDVEEDGCRLINLHPRNHIVVNGVPVKADAPVLLKAEDVIEMDWFSLRVTQVAVQEEEKPATAEDTSEPVTSTVPADMSGVDEGIISLYAGRTTGPGGRGGGDEPPTIEMPEFLRSAPPPPHDHSTETPPGLGRYSVRYLEYLPNIYQTDFTSRFMALFEAILMPIGWNVENFDLYLNAQTAPPAFVDWLASWFGITFDETWSIEKRRLFLTEANTILARKGTKWALQRTLEIYLGKAPTIIETNQPPNTFTVRIPFRERDVKRALIEQLIETHKPSHTTYVLEFDTRVKLDNVLSRLDF